jgi:hypothetical protein
MPIRKSWDILSRVNTHARDTRIVFEEKDHKYRIDGDTTGWKSVTEFLHKFHDPFDPKKSANAVMNSRRYKAGTHNLSGKNEEEIIAHWNSENKCGTALHARMERDMNHHFHLNLRSKRHSSGELVLEKRTGIFRKNSVSGDETEEHTVLVSNRNDEVYTYESEQEFGDISGIFLGYIWKDKTVRRNMLKDAELGEDEPILTYSDAVIETSQIKHFWRTHSNLKPYRSEWVIWDADWKIAGTIDALFQDQKDGSFWLLDWKRVRTGLEPDLEATRWGYIQKDDEWLEPVKPWAKKMPSPLQDLYNTKYWNYSLQLNMYKQILEKNYGIKIKGMKLVQFHPELGSECRVHDVVILEDQVRRVLTESSE